jgi:hypothetical protein
MFFRRKNKIKDLISKLEPLDLDEFLEVKGLSGRISPDKLRYPDGIPVTCLNFVETQLLTRELSNNGVKIRLPTLREDYIAFKNLDDKYRENALSSPFEWKAEYLEASFLMTNPEVRKVNLPREYDFHGPLRIINFSLYSKKFNNPIQWLGINEDKYDRAALVRGYFPNKDKMVYAAGMTPPLSRDCIGIRLFAEE